MKKVLVFGSTGTIGKNVLDIIRKNRNDFSVIGLSANRNSSVLMRQVREFNPAHVCLRDEKAVKRIRGALPSGVKVFSGEKGMEDFSSLTADMAVMGISGIASLKPLLKVIENVKQVAIASKEPLVVAGNLVKRKAGAFNTELLPVDSEINALFQMAGLFKRDDVRKIYLTASGGPLFNLREPGDLDRVKAKDVLAHPTWKMGKRITVDSATLVNKGFEVVEAHEFFGFDYSDIKIVIHRESHVHGMVELCDGTVFSCMYKPDMRNPLRHALYYPRRFPAGDKSCGFKTGRGMELTFSGDYTRFPLLKLVLRAAKRGGNSLAVVNAADEVAIDYFLRDRISFRVLNRAIKDIFSRSPGARISSFEDVMFWDDWARKKTKEYLEVTCC